MHLSLTVWFITLFFLILVAAFFAGSEIGMMALNRYRLHHLVKKKHRKAMLVNKMLAQPERLLSLILIGSTLANILSSMVATLIGQHIYGNLGVFIAEVILTIIILIFAEMLPKTLAAIYPQTLAFLFVRTLFVLQKIFSPLVILISSCAYGLLRILGVRLDKAQKEALTSEELRSVVHEAGGLLPIEHKTMVMSLLDLEQSTVEDIMILKNDIVGIDIDEPWNDLLAKLENMQHTRLPVYRSSLDNMVGMVHLRSVLNVVLEDKLNKVNLLTMTETPYFVPMSTKLNRQILNFRKMKRRSALVVNEYGDIQGLITLEDILEEIIGEFTTDIATLSKDIMPQADGSVIIDASITIRSLERLMCWQLPLLGPRTLSGIIIEYLGDIPSSECCLKLGDYYIEILKVGDNTIKNVRMWTPTSSH